MAETRGGPDGFRDEFFRGADDLFEAGAEGEAGGDRCRAGAAGAVSMRRVEARRGEFEKVAVGVEEVQRIALQMAAFDQHGPGPESADAAGRFAHFGDVPDRHAGECSGFFDIGGDEGRKRQ